MYFKITGNDHIFYQNITFSKNKFEIFYFNAYLLKVGFLNLNNPSSPKK